MASPGIADRLVLAARTASQLRRAAAEDPVLGRAVRLVKSWQAYRLSQTHQDLLLNPRYRAAAHFFVDDLYGSGSLTQRDAELARVIPTLTRFLPDAALTTICEAIELDALSESLDHKVAGELMFAKARNGLDRAGDDVRQNDESSVTGSGRREEFASAEFRPEVFNRAAYADAYRRAGSFAERSEQIAAVERIGMALDKLVRKPMLGGLLNTMRGPAKAAGLLAIHEFLVRGFSAFKSMGGAKEFMLLIQQRERELAEGLSKGDLSKLPN